MVKMKKAYFKDSIMMFKNNLFRYISIVLIIMLGTAFFIGMNSVSPAMQQTAEDYMKENNVYDVSLLSNLGYKNEDLDKFKQNENVKEVQGIYTYDVLAEFDEKDIAVRLSSINEDSDMNKSDISEGRDIENDNECLISSRLRDMYNYNIGDKIKVYRKDDTKVEDYLNYTEFEIVGITKTPIYLSKFYGNTTLLTGELNGYIMIREQAFKLEEYTAVYIKTNIDNNISKFSNEYNDKVEEILPNLEKINEEIAKDKYDAIYKESSKKISEAEESVKNAQDYLDKGYEQIRGYQLQINSAITNVSYVVASYYNSNNIYQKVLERNNNISSLYGTLQELNEKEAKLEKTYGELKPQTVNLKGELEELENDIDKNLYELYSLDDEETKFVELSKQTNDMYYEYNKKKENYENINKQYEEQKTELENTQKEITNTKSQIDTLQNELYNSFSSLEDLIYGINNSELISKTELIKKAKTSLETNLEELKNKNIEEQIEKAKRTNK